MTVSADSVRVAVVQETTAGSTPATPAFDVMRITGEGIQYEVNTTLSDEMGGLNRGVKDDILTGAQVTGDINFELTKNAAFEDLLDAVLGSDWGADPLTTTPTPTANQVYNYITVSSFTIEKTFPSSSTDGQFEYHRFTGCVPDTLTISVAPGDPINGTFGFLGHQMSTAEDSGAPGDGEIVGATYAGGGNNPVMTAPNVTSITLLERADDTPVPWTDTGCFTSLEIAINNNARGIECIGTLGLTGVNYGRFEVAITGSMYYSGVEPLDHLIDRKEFKLKVTMTDGTGNSYDWIFDCLNISSATALAAGTNTDVMVEMVLSGLEGEPDPYTLWITRAPGAAVFAQTAPASRSKTEMGKKAKEAENV